MNKITDNKKLISIVVPVFNEEDNIHELYRRLKKVMIEHDYLYEVIFVDDGSEDKSLYLLTEMSRTDNRVKFISFSRNFGHQIAITAGMEYTLGDAVIVMDADLQHPPEVIPQMIAKWEEGFEIVSTIREDATGIGFFKKLTAFVFYKLINRISDTDIQANSPDFRLLDRRVINALKSMKERGRFVRGLVGWVGFNQIFIKFVADERYAGTTKYSLKKMFKFAFDGITAFSSFPLRISIHLGIAATVIPLPYAIYAIYIRLFTDIAAPGWASILVAIVFLGGVQLITIGIIGEYIARIYDEVKGRPVYIVKETAGFEDNLSKGLMNQPYTSEGITTILDNDEKGYNKCG
ncbi:glycosyltransferase family 2 protein [bacterium]|nr:glycosyltransferase family 2 protein [bacterium]